MKADSVCWFGGSLPYASGNTGNAMVELVLPGIRRLVEETGSEASGNWRPEGEVLGCTSFLDTEFRPGLCTLDLGIPTAQVEGPYQLVHTAENPWAAFVRPFSSTQFWVGT